MNEEYIVEEVTADELSYLKSISEDLHAIRLIYEEQSLQQEETVSAAEGGEMQEPVETTSPEQASDTADTDKQLELMEAIQVSVSGIETKVESIDLEASLKTLEKNTGNILSSSEQTNTFLVVAVFGVFLVLGFLLAKLCWSRFLGDRDG